MSLLEIADLDKFEETISSAHGVVLVDFWAPWCGPCRMMAPVIDDIAHSENDLLVIKVDVDKAQEISSKYKIQSVPTLILFKDSNEIDSKNGYHSKQSIIEWIKHASA